MMNPDLFNALLNYSNAMRMFQPQNVQQQQMPQQQMMQQPPQQQPMQTPPQMYLPQNLSPNGALNPSDNGGPSIGDTVQKMRLQNQNQALNDSNGGGGGMMGMMGGLGGLFG